MRAVPLATSLAVATTLGACASPPPALMPGSAPAAVASAEPEEPSAMTVAAVADAEPPLPSPRAARPSPPLPRPLSPPSSTTLTSARPTFRAALRDPSRSATVELCRTRACDAIESSFTLENGAGRPPSKLAPGTHFWRIREGDALSATWRVSVGRREPRVAAAWGPRLDVDGDGRVDVVVHVPTNGQEDVHDVGLFLGRATGIGLTAAQQLRVANGAVTLVGDVDGDGLGDVFLGDTLHVARAGKLVRTELVTPAGAAVAGADVDGDGYADVAVSNPDGASEPRVVVHRGGPGGLDDAVAVSLALPPGLAAWPTAMVLVDLDGDGHADLVTTGNDAHGATALLVHAGSAKGLATTEATRIVPTDFTIDFGLASVGDIDGDGHPDVALHGPGDTVALFRGRSATSDAGKRAGPSRTDGAYLRPRPILIRRPVLPGVLALAGTSFGPGDVDGDGFDDLVLGTDGNTPPILFRGGPGGPRAPGLAMASLDQTSSVAVGDQGGDVDGDGLADALLPKRSAMDNAVEPWLFLGTKLGLVRATER